jgi:YbgC/YbaW family acyl-CoA thioester hydrolase
MSNVFHTTRRVEFADTDMAGIIHFASYFRYMESAEHEFLRSRGLSVVMDWQGQAIGFPRVSAGCDFLKPARFEDVLAIEVQLTRVGARSLTWSFTFQLDGHPVARGRLTSVCCRVFPAEHRVESIEIPDEIRRRLLGPVAGAPGL